MNLQDEKTLVEKAKTSPAAFGKLYDLYYTKIFNYALRRTGEVAVAGDITSDTFFKAMKNLSKFKWQGVPFSSWIYKIASNEINSYFRKKRFCSLSLDFLYNKHGFEVVDNTNLQEEYIKAQKQLGQHEDFQQAQNMLKKLPGKYQEVIILRFFENKKINEISQITGKNNNTVKSLLKRGLNKLKIQLLQKKENKNRTLKTQPNQSVSVLKVKDNYDT